MSWRDFLPHRKYQSLGSAGKHSIELTTELALRIFCLVRQAELSVDAALPPWVDWPDFLAYYTPERREAVEETCGTLKELLSGVPCVPLIAAREEMIAAWRSFSVFWWRVRQLLPARARNTHKMRGGEAWLLLHLCEAVRSIVAEEKRPGNDALVKLRMDLCDCEYLLQRRCLKVDFDKANSIEHFMSAKHVVTLTLEQVVGP